MKTEWHANFPLLIIGFTSILSVACYEYRPRRSSSIYGSKGVDGYARKRSVGDMKGTATDKKFLDEVLKMKKTNRPPVFNFHNLNSSITRQQIQLQQQQQQQQSQHLQLRKDHTTERGTVIESVLTTPNNRTKFSSSSGSGSGSGLGVGVKSKPKSKLKPRQKLRSQAKSVSGIKYKSSQVAKIPSPSVAQIRPDQDQNQGKNTNTNTNSNARVDAEEDDGESESESENENDSDTTPSARITSTTTGEASSTSTSTPSTSSSTTRSRTTGSLAASGKSDGQAENGDANENEDEEVATTTKTTSTTAAEPEPTDAEPEPESEMSSKSNNENNAKLQDLMKYINDQVKDDTVPETEKIEELQKLVKEIKDNPDTHKFPKKQMKELQRTLDKLREQVQSEVQKLSKALDNIDDNVDSMKNVSPESNDGDSPSFKGLKKVIHEIQTSVRDLDPDQIDRLEEHVEELFQFILRSGSLSGTGAGSETGIVPAELLVEVYGVVDDVKEKLHDVEIASGAVNRLEDKVNLIKSQDQIISEILSQKVVKLQQLMDEIDYKVRVDENPSEETIDALDNLLGEMKNYHLEVPTRQLRDLKFIIDTAKQYMSKNGGSTLMLDKINEDIKGEVTVYNAFQEVSRPKLEELKRILETIKNNKNNTAGEVDLIVLEEAVTDIVQGIQKEPLESEISRSDVIKLEGVVEDLQAKLQKRHEIQIIKRIQKKVDVIQREAPKSAESRPELLAQLQALIDYIDTRLKLEAVPRNSKITELEKVIEKIKFTAQAIPPEQMNETERVIINLVELTEAEGVATTKVDQILDDLEVVNSTGPEEYVMGGGKLTEVEKLKEVMHDARTNLQNNQTEEIPIENLAEAIEYVVDEVKEKLDMVQLPPFEMEMLENILCEIREKSADPEVLEILDLLEERVDEIKQPELELPKIVVAEGNLTDKLQGLVDKYRNTSVVQNEEVNKVGALMQEFKKKRTDKGIVSREYVAALEKLIINLHKQRKEAKLRDMLVIFTEIHIQNLEHPDQDSDPDTPLRKKMTARHLARFQRRKRRLKKEHVVGVLKKSSKKRSKVKPKGKSKSKSRKIVKVKANQRSMRLPRSKKSRASRHKRWSINERYYADYR